MSEQETTSEHPTASVTPAMVRAADAVLIKWRGKGLPDEVIAQMLRAALACQRKSQ